MMGFLRSFLFPRRGNHRFLKINWPHSARAAFRCRLLAMAWANACASAAAQVPASGFVVVSPSGKTYFHLTHAPEADVPLWAQWPGPDGQPVCCRKFTLQELAPVSVRAGEGHAAMTASGREALSYEWRGQASPAPAMPFAGMVLAAPRVRAGSVAQLRAGRMTRARMCQGAEGINLLTQSGRYRSALYLGLGYGIQSPSRPCTREDERFIERAQD